jgi:hypothetical protein
LPPHAIYVVLGANLGGAEGVKDIFIAGVDGL